MRRVLLVVALPILAACGRSNPVAPSTSVPSLTTDASVSEVSPLARTTSSSQELCDTMDLAVSAIAASGADVMAGAVHGSNGGGVVDGEVTVSFGPLLGLRSGQSQAPQQEHTFSTADGSFTLAGGGRLSPLSGRPGVFKVSERLPVTAGTHIFVGATGDLRLDGELDLNAATVTYTVRGRLCRTGEAWVDPIE